MTEEQAKTVLSQMGGIGKLIAMVGAKDFLRGTNNDTGLPYLAFKFKGAKHVNYIRITLEPTDVYTVFFGNVKGLTFRPGCEFVGVHADRLIPTFEQHTGLYLRF